MNFKIQENESREHFIWRVYKFGYETGELTKDQAGEICSSELNEPYDESAYRKVIQSFNKVWEEVKYEYVGENTKEHIEEIEKKQDELYKMKVRNSDYVRTKRTLLRDEARFDELKEILVDSIENLPVLNIRPFIIENTENEAILMFSDFHYGIEVDNYWNTYNTDIAIKRINKLISKTIYNCKKNNVTDLYVSNLNDLISGGLHMTTRIHESIDTVQQAIAVGEIVANMLINIQNSGIRVHYMSVTDNHSRRSTNWRESVEGDSWVKVIDEFISLRTQGKIHIISNIFDEQISYVELSGDKKIFSVHGHRDKPQNVIENMINATNIIPTHVLMGHYHSKSMYSKPNTKVFINGSVVGVDQYSKDSRYFNKPSQTLLIFDGEDEIDIDIKL